MLRDFAKRVGITLKASEFNLGEELFESKNEFKYELLPFSQNQIVAFNAVVNEFKLPSDVHRPYFEQGESFFKTGNLIQATERFRQIIFFCNEIYGPVNRYSAIAHKKLASLAIYEGDYMNSILLMKKAISIFEKLFEYDTPVVSSCYLELSGYYHAIGEHFKAFEAIYKSLEIINFIVPKNVFFF